MSSTSRPGQPEGCGGGDGGGEDVHLVSVESEASVEGMRVKA